MSTVYETFAIGLTLTTAMAVPGMSTMAVAGMSVTSMMPFMVSVMSMARMVPFMVSVMSMARMMAFMSMAGVMAIGSCDCELTEAQSKGKGDSNWNGYKKCSLFLHCVLHYGCHALIMRSGARVSSARGGPLEARGTAEILFPSLLKAVFIWVHHVTSPSPTVATLLFPSPIGRGLEPALSWSKG